MATKKAAAKAPAKKKAAAAKTPAKKAPAKKAPAAKAAAPAVKAISDKMTKTQIVAQIAENTGLTKKQVDDVFGQIENLIHGSIKKRGVGEFTLPGLMKIVTVRKPAQKAKKNVPNPFKPGEFMDVAAKPASVAVKVRPLKKLKDFAN